MNDPNYFAEAANRASEVVGAVGTIAGGAEIFSGSATFSWRYGVYTSGWGGNQYVSAQSLGEFAHWVGVVGLGVSTAFDYASASNGGISWSRFGTNLGVGLSGLAGGVLTVLPASQYFIFTTLYDHTYPGGSQQAFTDLGGTFHDIAATGLGP